MPRIATQISADVSNARTLLASYLARPGNTELALSALSGVPQYTISKFYTGRIKSLTPEVQKFLRFANIGIIEGTDFLLKDPRIQRALGHAWDGTEQGATLIANAIEALAPVIRSARPK